ncbi:MAG: methylenetetrahydrofolate reductase, partial [Plantibacter flavus]
MITTEPACPGRTPFSFELYPPKTLDGGVALARTVEHLAAAGPEFISVTFGAGGSSRTASLDVLRSIR